MGQSYSTSANRQHRGRSATPRNQQHENFVLRGIKNKEIVGVILSFLSSPNRLDVKKESLAGSVNAFAGWFYYHKAAPKLAWFQDVESMLNHHLAGLLGLGSLSWAGHQVHVSLPTNQFLKAGVDPKEIPLPHEFILNRHLLAQLYPSFAEGAAPFFTLNWSKYTDFLTFCGGLDPVTGGLWLTDIVHYYLAIAIFFLVAGHMYKTNWGIGHGLKDILEAHKGPFTGQGHKGLYEILTTSWHAKLSLNLAMLGSLTIVVAHHMYSMPPYPYLAADYGTQLLLFTYHMWIGGFLIVGAATHVTIFMVRDYDPTIRYNDLLDHVLRHRDAIISHLNWACIFLGFHSFCLYIHNDTMSALGHPQDMFSDTSIQLQPVFAQWIQNTHALAPRATTPGATASTSLTWGCERGYWKELIESIIWAHNKLKAAPATQPRALSIIQGRAVGVTHYLLGGIATTWAFFLARIIAVG
ncbi:Photosystem I chlorophyll a apoprotein A1 [Capsicum annuum]|nr:Photosystem I chlorophyll a apoprotein A1 [Capsicum annuum]KAF3669730.1 Photosystem I chlorophyll a apoprotein A1 [Capsicum annuum]